MGNCANGSAQERNREGNGFRRFPDGEFHRDESLDNEFHLKLDKNSVRILLQLVGVSADHQNSPDPKPKPSLGQPQL
jgi:hypothetical protein